MPRIEAVLGEEASRFAAYYGVSPRGNFEGRNVLWVRAPDEDTWDALAAARAKLQTARALRVPPLRDEKVVTAWNGLAISALAQGGRVLGEERFVTAAASAARFLLNRLRPDGRLARSFAQGRPGGRGFLQDHAFLLQGLLDLHEATFEPGWLEEALSLGETTERLFADPRGGWFVAAEDGERLIAREKPTHDGAEPSGASVALENALRLEAFTSEARWREVAERALNWYAPALSQSPQAFGELLLALDAYTDGARQVVLVWPETGAPGPCSTCSGGRSCPATSSPAHPRARPSRVWRGWPA